MLNAGASLEGGHGFGEDGATVSRKEGVDDFLLYRVADQFVIQLLLLLLSGVEHPP